MTSVLESVKRTLEAFARFVDAVYYRRDPPYVWLTGRGWRRCSGQSFPVSRRQMREHLFGGRFVFGCRGVFSPAWTALDLDRCLGESARLTEEALASLRAVDRAFGGVVVPLRSSYSGNLHLWLHHAPMSVTLRDVCVVKQLAEYASDAAHVRAGCVEIYPKPDVNFRWPFGLGSVLLEPGPLLEGLEVPVETSKEEQITRFVGHPLYEFPSLADGLRELRALGREGRPLISMPSQPPITPATPVIKHFDRQVRRWLEEGPGPGEHNAALGAVTFWHCVQGWPPDILEEAVWEWQSTKATRCREWVQEGPASCRNHVRRWVRSVLKGYRPYEKVADAIDAAGVPVSDVSLGLELFPRDVRLQRAFFEFCRFVRPRLARYYTSGIMPISSHLRWRSFSKRQHRVLQTRLADAGLCAPVYSASIGRSTLYRVTLPLAEGEEFASWEVGVWEVCGRNQETLLRHFSRDQMNRIFSRTQFGTVSGIR